MKNWRTSLAGLVTGLPVAIDALVQAYNSGAFTGKTGTQLLIAIALVGIGLLAKDKNVTGSGASAKTTAEIESENNGTAKSN